MEYPLASYSLQVHSLTKKYRIDQGVKAQYGTLRDALTKLLPGHKKSTPGFPVAKPSERIDRQSHILWALNGIDFTVRPGEIVGIIGPNGAGKSTLLKILTRITYPTSGSIDIYGRVGSLLEVGTGFHKELTGRENVFLNGAILGMKKTEIDRKFDEIVAFSEMSSFIDTPVKFYSSGMAVRLAFAIAAHLEPEILLVDEVLAVGDAAFQKKCINKMEDVGRQGRTIIFVSHHMPSITRLCERAILLKDGKMMLDGPASEVVGKYLVSVQGTTSEKVWLPTDAKAGSGITRLCAVRIIDESYQNQDTFDVRDRVGVQIEFEVLTGGYVIYPGFSLHNQEGQWLFASLDSDPAWRQKPRPIGRYTSIGWIPGNFLAEGTMLIGPSLRTNIPNRVHAYEEEAVAFQVTESPGESITARMDYGGKYPGLLRPLLEWESRNLSG